jgi:spore coat protein U-like protein
MIFRWKWGTLSVKWIRNILAGAAVAVAIAGAAGGEDCSVTLTPAHFGAYDFTASSSLETVADISINCDPGIIYNVKIDPGQHSGGGFHPRRMRSAAGDSDLNYYLYRDLGRTEVWGDGTGSTFTRTGMGTGAPENLRIYGRVTARQNVRAGLHSDSVVVIVEW